MTRKDSINKLRDLLVTRRNALRKALAGDLSLLKQLREQTGGDVVDAALDAAQDEISSQLAEVESRELANIDRACCGFARTPTANAKAAATRSRSPASMPSPTPRAASNASGQRKPAAAPAARAAIGAAFSTPVLPTPTSRSPTWRSKPGAGNPTQPLQQAKWGNSK